MRSSLVRFCLALLAFVWCHSSYGNVESLRRRLLSGNAEAEESALRDIMGGAGDETLLDDIERVSRRRCTPPGPHDIVERGIDAVVALRQRYPLESATQLFRMVDLPDPGGRASERAAREFIRSGQQAASVIRYVLGEQDADPQRLSNLMIVARSMPAEFGGRIVPWVRTALLSGNRDVIYQAAITIDRYIERGTPKEVFAPLFPELIAVLRDRQWLPQEDVRFSHTSNPHFWVAGTAAVVMGANAELLTEIQRIYSQLRTRDIGLLDNQNWMNFINLARGRSAQGLDLATFARDTLDRILSYRRENGTGRVRVRDFDRVEARSVVGRLGQLEREEAEALLGHFMRLGSRGNRFFRAQVAYRLSRSSNPILAEIARGNPKCVRLFEMINQRRNNGGAQQ